MPALSSTSPALNTPVPCGPVGWQNAIRNRSVPVRPSCGRVRVRGSQRSRPDHAPRRGCSSDRHRAAVLRVWHTASDTGSSEGLVVDVDVRGALFSARIGVGSSLDCVVAEEELMKITTILDHIDGGHMALPEFQRGYVWNREQVRGLMGSLYRGHPVGSLLVWATQAEGAAHRGESENSPLGPLSSSSTGSSASPRCTESFAERRPHSSMATPIRSLGCTSTSAWRDFSFYSPVKMRDDPLWIDVSRLMQDGYKWPWDAHRDAECHPRALPPRGGVCRAPESNPHHQRRSICTSRK